MDIKPGRQHIDETIVILPVDADYIDQLVVLQHQAYNVPLADRDHPEILRHEDYLNHLNVFPEGQFMALDITTDTVVGSCSSMMIEFDAAKPLLKSWGATTSFGALSTHNPAGNWLYGVDNVVQKAYRGKGVGGRLMQARFNLARKYNLCGMVAGSLPIDYGAAAEADGVSIETYVADVIAGRRWDTNLSKQIKKGFEIHNIIPNYLMDAPRTRNYAVAILRKNPDYRPVKKPAVVHQHKPTRGIYTQPGN